MPDLQWECPDCETNNRVGPDWDTCTQVCEGCNGEFSVELEVSSVEKYKEPQKGGADE